MSAGAAKIMALTAAINLHNNNSSPEDNQDVTGNNSNTDEPFSASFEPTYFDEGAILFDNSNINMDTIPVLVEDINLTANSSVEYIILDNNKALYYNGETEQERVIEQSSIVQEIASHTSSLNGREFNHTGEVCFIEKCQNNEHEEQTAFGKYPSVQEQNLQSDNMIGKDNDTTKIVECDKDREELDPETGSEYEPDEEEDSTALNNVDDISLMEKACKRKKKEDLSTWNRLVNKKRRMEGKSYSSTLKDDEGNKLKQPARKLGVVCKCKSLARSCNTVGEKVRKEIFDMFWKLNWENKKNYIRSLVTYEETKRCYVATDSRRKGTFYYHLQVENKKLKVCKKFFLSTLGMKERSVRDWVIQPSVHGMPKCKETKKHLTNKQQKNDERKDLMKEFINLIPKLPSHYCRADTKKLYFEESFKNKTEIYELYKKHCEKQQCTPLSICVFMTTLSEMNISIHQPKKDQCDLCCSYKVGQISDDEYRQHIERKELARSEKNKDKEAALRGECYLFTMDVQAVKLCPMLYASKLYFKSKLQVHNFSIYNLRDHHCVNYCWNETEGELVSSTFTTCILKHLEDFCLVEKKTVIIYSDGCGYQNRNVTLSNALLNFAIQHGVTIFQKFLEKGHTQMEVDSAHALIERKLKGREIHLPSQYPILIKEARKNPSPFEVRYLTDDFFLKYDSKDKFRYQSIRPGRKKDDPTVNQLKCLKYETDGIIYYKTDYQECYNPLPQRLNTNLAASISKERLYKNRLSITKQKYDHLQELTQVLPLEVKTFYDNIPFCAKKTEK